MTWATYRTGRRFSKAKDASWAFTELTLGIASTKGEPNWQEFQKLPDKPLSASACTGCCAIETRLLFWTRPVMITIPRKGTTRPSGIAAGQRRCSVHSVRKRFWSCRCTSKMGRFSIPSGSIYRRAKRSSVRSEEHTSELQSQSNLVCRLLLEKKKKTYQRACDSAITQT